MNRVDRRTLLDRRRAANRRTDRRGSGERRVMRESPNRRAEHVEPVADRAPEQLGAGVTGTIGVRSHTDRVAITPDGAYAYVKNGDDGLVLVIRTADNTVLATLGPDGAPVGPTIEAEHRVRGALAPSAQARIEEIGNRIRGLVATGVLRSAWAQAFLAQLNRTAQELRAAQPSPTTSLLQTFVHQVTRFERAGILTPSQANALRIAVQGAIREIGA
jgi:YVTN family beta-propeller protein